MKNKTNKILTIAGLVLSMILILIVLGLILFKWKQNSLKDNNSNSQYKLTYQNNNGDIFRIYRTKENKVIVDSDTQPICITDLCPRITQRSEIKFNEKDMKIITEFIDSFFKNQNYQEKTITKGDIREEDFNKLYSIIYLDESYLNQRMYILSSNKYTITTDMKWKTMLNDGGSYRSIIYEIDLKYNEVTKKEENYNATSNQTNTSILYTKKIDYTLYETTTTIIGETIEKVDIKPENNDYYYTITSDNENKEIYNLQTISKINNLLNQYDEFNMSAN